MSDEAIEIGSSNDFNVAVKPSQRKRRPELNKGAFHQRMLAKRLERDIVKDIMDYLESIGCAPIKNHGSPYSKRGRPDIEVDIAFEGLPFAVPFYIEVKRHRDLEPTPQQRARIKAHMERGGVAFVAADAMTVREAIAMTRAHIENWLRRDEVC